MELQAGDIIKDALENADGQAVEVAARTIEERAKRLQNVQTDTRDSLSGALEETREKLDDAAKDLRDLEGVSIKSFDGNIAGQAMVGQEGTATVDMEKALQDDGSFNMDFANGVKAHEERHEKQVLASTDILETDAMLAAEEEVPGSINDVSTEYKAILARTLARYTEEEVADIALGNRTEDEFALAA